MIQLDDGVCSCGSITVPRQVIAHEVGHAMGFFTCPTRLADVPQASRNART
jgi:hypothetical protein